MSDTTQDTTETPALPGDGLRESIVDDLRRHIGEGLVEFLLKPQDDLWIRVSADMWGATGRALQSMGFEYFCFLSAIDWKPSPFGRGEDDPTQPPPERTTEVKQGYAGGASRFQVFARVTDPKRHVGVTLKVDVDDVEDGAPLAIDSWHAVYAGANWHEREAHEMYGISFNGHPDLRNMYLPTDFEGYPQRKDFPLLARMVKPWPGIVDVEPMPVDEAAEAGGEGEAAGVAAGAAKEGADAPAAGDHATTAVEEAPEVDSAAGADGSAVSVSENVTESGVSADTEAEAASVTPPGATDVEAQADQAADEARVADDAAAAEVADGQTATAEAVPIEAGAPTADAPTDPASTDDAGPGSEAADHPESASEPADATEETAADAPDHSDLEATEASESVTASAPDRGADDTETGVGSASEQPEAEPKAEP